MFVENVLLTEFFLDSNLVCRGQKFLSAEEAIQAMEISEREENDPSLDYCPPYKVVHTFDYNIVFYSYCYGFDDTQSTSYAVKILKHNDDGTLYFDSGLASEFKKKNNWENLYYSD